jgi:PAS domain S-box-containing protein
MKSKSDLLGDLATMQRLFEYSEAASVCIDTNGKIALVNRKVEQLTGYSKAEIEGNKTWKDFILEEEHDEVSRYLQLLRANPNELSERREIRFRDKENNLHTGLLNAIILPEHKILVLSIVDITEQKAYESDLEKAKAEGRNLNN